MRTPVRTLGSLFCVLGAAAASCDRTAPATEPADPANPTDRPVPNLVVQDDWPCFRGQPQLTGLAGGEIPADLSLAWTYETGGPVLSSPVIAGERVYVGSNDGRIHAISLADGERQWAVVLGDEENPPPVEAPPLVARGRVWVGEVDGVLWCLSAADGEVLWRFATDDKIVGSAALAMVDGAVRILVGSHDNFVYCLDEDGALVWRYESDSFVNGAPAVDGSITVFGGCDGLLHVVSLETGQARGRFEVGSYVAGSAALAGGRAFVGHYGGMVASIDVTTGETVWEYGSDGSPFFSTPAVDDSRVIVGGRDQSVHCLAREDGRRLWTFPTRGEVDSSPVICGSRAVVASADGRLYVLDVESGERIWSYEIGSEIVSTPAVARGTVVIGSQDGSIHAFASRGAAGRGEAR